MCSTHRGGRCCAARARPLGCEWCGCGKSCEFVTGVAVRVGAAWHPTLWCTEDVMHQTYCAPVRKQLGLLGVMRFVSLFTHLRVCAAGPRIGPRHAIRCRAMKFVAGACGRERLAEAGWVCLLQGAEHWRSARAEAIVSPSCQNVTNAIAFSSRTGTGHHRNP